MLKPNSILIDVGAGTGTIGIEAATYMPQGKVYAIEKEEKGLDTIRLNAEKFNLDNFELIYGKAPEAIPNIPYDRMFIGGSTGGIEDIINHFLTYAKDEAILVINCITLETQSKSLEILKKQVSVDGTKKYLIKLPIGGAIESVLMSYNHRIYNMCINTKRL